MPQSGSFFRGFGTGLVRGFAGLPAITLAGLVTGSNQFYLGVYKAPPNPGHGLTTEENWRHIVYSKYLNLVSNKEPKQFKEELAYLIEQGLVPEKKFDHTGKEVPHTYQFFITDEPADFVEGFGQGQYNFGKGFITGVVLGLSAPIVDAQEFYDKEDPEFREEKQKEYDALLAELEATAATEGRTLTEEEKPPAIKPEDVRAGFEGGVKGLGQGAARGFVGGMLLFFSGAAYGLLQTAKGFASLKNIPMMAHFIDQTEEDYERIKNDPIKKFILQKGYGLEEYIIADKEAKEAEKVRFEKARDEWLLADDGFGPEQDWDGPKKPENFREWKWKMDREKRVNYLTQKFELKEKEDELWDAFKAANRARRAKAEEDN